MGNLGQLLKEARDQKGASLEDVEEATHIRQKFLQALEEGDFGALPAQTYVKGFLRTYATYLGLDPEEVMALYEEREDKGKTDLPQPGFFQPMDISMAAPSWLTSDMVMGALMIAVLLVFGCWGTWNYLPPTIKTQLSFWRAMATTTATPSPTATASAVLPPATPTAVPTTTPTVTSTTVLTSGPTATPTTAPTRMPTEMPSATPILLPTVEAIVEPTSTSTATSVPTSTPTSVSTSSPTTTSTSTPTNTSTPSVSTGIEVELNIVEYAWLRVLVDGEEVFVGSLEAGTTRTWQGRESVVLRCGNAGGVEATVNGEFLGLLGERGQVVDMEWFAEGVSPTPSTPEATTTATP